MPKRLINSPEGQTVEEFPESERDWVPPIDWMRRIQSRADTELQRGVSVTIDGTTYGIRTGAVALAVIAGAGLRAERAERLLESITRKVPTDRGVVAFDGPALLAIFEAAEAHQQAVVSRVEELQELVNAGAITEADLEVWP